MTDFSQEWVGVWKRSTHSPCSQVYPLEIAFRPDGTYQGTGSQPGGLPGWDSGTYSVVSENQVRISTMNDKIIPYQYSLAGDVLTLIEPGGCEFSYERLV